MFEPVLGLTDVTATEALLSNCTYYLFSCLLTEDWEVACYPQQRMLSLDVHSSLTALYFIHVHELHRFITFLANTLAHETSNGGW